MEKKLQNFHIAQIAASGQCFRMQKKEDDHYLVISKDRAVTVKQLDLDMVRFDCEQNEFDDYWQQYFDLNVDYSRFCNTVPLDDSFLQEAIKYGFGLRILKQDLWEIMVSFIISQNNNIPRIQASIEQLCTNFGDKKTMADGSVYCGFPLQDQLRCASMDDLRQMGLGYRDQYLYTLARTELPLEELQCCKWAEAHKILTSFLGIGPKVAGCICLFGLHHLDAFPIDTWIRKIILKHYNGSFPLEQYEGFAGVIQQYMFYYGRAEKNIKKDKIIFKNVSSIVENVPTNLK